MVSAIYNAYTLAEYLKERCNGEEKAVRAVELASTFSTDRRGIRDMVNFLRCSGEPICSGMSGYWYSDNPDDIERTIATMRAKITGIQKAITGLKIAKENTGEIGG